MKVLKMVGEKCSVFCCYSSIGFIFEDLAKIQIRFKEPGISHFCPRYSRMSQILLWLFNLGVALRISEKANSIEGREELV